MKKAFLFSSILVIVVFLVTMFLSRHDVDDVSVHPDQTSSQVLPTFSWRFEDAKTNNLDGIPQTNVYLVAKYNNKQLDRLVDTVDGGCSELEGESHEGDISGTGKVQCYSAGLGQKYRITRDGNRYLIERKLFEEALPNVTPPNYDWEVVGETL